MSKRLKFKPMMLMASVLIGLIAYSLLIVEPDAPEIRVPAEKRLDSLIERLGEENEYKRSELKSLTNMVRARSITDEQQQNGEPNKSRAINAVDNAAGFTDKSGTGFRIVLQDSDMPLVDSSNQNVNDRVIHSGDVNAAINAFWASGADAVAVNGQRLISTSAVMCVGNTLLVNGTVHAPPYVVSGIGANRDAVMSDDGVKKLFVDHEVHGIRVNVSKPEKMTIPAYEGSSAVKFAKPIEFHD